MLLEQGAVTMRHPGTSIALPLRVWFAVEVFFGVSAVLSIGVDPANTRTNFAWNVQPVVMAAVLGAYYISSALLFLLPLFARRWEMIRVMVLPTALFSTAELITTLLHWSKFSIGTIHGMVLELPAAAADFHRILSLARAPRQTGGKRDVSGASAA